MKLNTRKPFVLILRTQPSFTAIKRFSGCSGSFPVNNRVLTRLSVSSKQRLWLAFPLEVALQSLWDPFVSPVGSLPKLATSPHDWGRTAFVLSQRMRSAVCPPYPNATTLSFRNSRRHRGRRRSASGYLHVPIFPARSRWCDHGDVVRDDAPAGSPQLPLVDVTRRPTSCSLTADSRRFTR